MKLTNLRFIAVAKRHETGIQVFSAPVGGDVCTSVTYCIFVKGGVPCVNLEPKMHQNVKWSLLGESSK